MLYSPESEAVQMGECTIERSLSSPNVDVSRRFSTTKSKPFDAPQAPQIRVVTSRGMGPTPRVRVMSLVSYFSPSLFMSLKCFTPLDLRLKLPTFDVDLPPYKRRPHESRAGGGGGDS